MQNKQISLKLFLAALLFGTGAMAQEVDLLDEAPSDTEVVSDAATEVVPVEDVNPTPDISSSIAQKKAVDFPARSSLDSLELAPLPGIYETNITGPQPMAESVSINDTPSEQLLGRLTPEVFQEMAELERDTAFLSLQVKKEQMKNELENARALYRQARLEEIQKREDLVRSRIQWWQEQEKLRQEVEKERQEAEEVKNQMAETEALRAQLEAEAAAQAGKDRDAEDENDNVNPVVPAVSLYSLVDVKGTRGQLSARVKNVATDEIVSVKVGDDLGGEIVTAITSENVVIDRNGTEYLIKFPN